METSSAEISAKFLLNASLLYKDRCPELSRFLLQQPVFDEGLKRVETSSLSLSPSTCPYCHQWLQADNHRFRLRPKRRPAARIQSVLHRRARGKRLSLMQRKLLQRFQMSSSVLMATCHTCNKTSRIKGANREFIAALSKTHGTPGSAGKHRTPQATSRSTTATPKSAGKDKTPVNTPRSTSTNTPGSAASTSKPKHSIVQRLSKILMREDSQGRKKGGLKDFLSSL
ncbi:UPF0711 protein C18orf21 homolog [Genypterus blacodes]|uniref:UPF0711 protein C18orf21 homolog n=1 Tax=Genypterus blacodes TaxID=154954 RepID=UPI003F776A64